MDDDGEFSAYASALSLDPHLTDLPLDVTS